MASLVFTDIAGDWRTGSDFPKIPLTRVSWDNATDTAVAYVFFGHVNVDFDGSPTAYGPADIRPLPDDDLGNAGNDVQGWFGVMSLKPDDPLVTSGKVVLDTNPSLQKRGKFPVVQQAANGDPNPGYYVSTTPHPTGPGYLQSSYVNASEVAFGALSGKLHALGVSLGDFGVAVRHDQNLQSGFYYLDVGGNTYALGECSVKVGTNLGGSGRGNRFNNNFPVSFIVFPFSADASASEPLTDDQIKTALQSLFSNLSSADNAADLVFLMGFNEVSPPSRPQGTSKLASYKSQPSASSKPKHAAAILAALQTLGYTATLASDDGHADDSSSDSSGVVATASTSITDDANSSSDSATNSGSTDPSQPSGDPAVP